MSIPGMQGIPTGTPSTCLRLSLLGWGVSSLRQEHRDGWVRNRSICVISSLQTFPGQRGLGSCCASLWSNRCLAPSAHCPADTEMPRSWLVRASQDRVQQLGTWLWRGLEAVAAPEMSCVLQAAAALAERRGRDSTAGISKMSPKRQW